MRLAKIFVPAICTAAAVVLTSVAASAATSAPRTPVTSSTAVTATAMHVTGFDASVAAAHGYVIRTAADGKQYSAKQGAAAPAATPENVVGGNCGYSYVYEYGIGNRAIELYTGFSVIAPEVGGHWQVRLHDRGGTSFRNYNVQPSGNGIWQIDQVIGGLTRGPAQAIVSSAASFTILDNGAVCYSGGPSDTTTIT
jgi:hypothetical protein